MIWTKNFIYSNSDYNLLILTWAWVSYLYLSSCVLISIIYSCSISAWNLMYSVKALQTDCFSKRFFIYFNLFSIIDGSLSYISSNILSQMLWAAFIFYKKWSFLSSKSMRSLLPISSFWRRESISDTAKGKFSWS